MPENRKTVPAFRDHPPGTLGLFSRNGLHIGAAVG